MVRLFHLMFLQNKINCVLRESVPSFISHAGNIIKKLLYVEGKIRRKRRISGNKEVYWGTTKVGNRNEKKKYKRKGRQCGVEQQLWSYLEISNFISSFETKRMVYKMKKKITDI